MKREHLAFLAGGLAFGLLFGFGLFHVIDQQPDLQAASAGAGEIAGPQGPRAPTDAGSAAPPADAAPRAAPMIARINELKHRVEQDPRDLEALVELAGIYHEVAMWEQAAGFYQRALALEQNHPDLLTNLGMCYRGMQKYDQALELFQQANREHPEHWQSLFNIVITAGQDPARFDMALKALEAIEALAPRELDAQKLLELRRWLEGTRAGGPTEGRS